MIRHDPVGGRVSGGEQPGTHRLHHWMLDHFGGTSYGIYNPASRVGSGGLSLHAEGRAADHRVPVTSEGRVLGDRIFDWLVANADAIGLQEAQFYGRIWTARRAGEGIRQDTPANTSAHRDHVHWGQNWDGAHGHTSWYQDAKTPPRWEDPEVEPMIVVDPTRSVLPNGWQPHLRTEADHLVLMHGASLAHDEPVPEYGIRVWRLDHPDRGVLVPGERITGAVPDPLSPESRVLVTTTHGNCFRPVWS